MRNLDRLRIDVVLEPEAPGGDPPLDLDLLEEAARLLGGAERPLICSGGGLLGSGGWDALRELSQLLEAPVLMTDNGRGAVSDRDYHAQTGVLANRALDPHQAAVSGGLAERTRGGAPSRWRTGNVGRVLECSLSFPDGLEHAILVVRDVTEAVDAEDYERAAELRDRISALEAS